MRKTRRNKRYYVSKREDYKRFIVFCLASLVVLAQMGVFAYVWYNFYRGQIDEPFWRKGTDRNLRADVCPVCQAVWWTEGRISEED